MFFVEKGKRMNIAVPLILNEMPTKEGWDCAYSNKLKAKIAFNIAIRVYHRTILSEAQNHKCCYCGCEMTEQRNYKNSSTIDHVIPKSKGGPDHLDNYVIACFSCNTKRGITPANQFYIERSCENRKQLLRTQMKEIGLRFDKRSNPARLQRKLDSAEVQMLIKQGLPNPYEYGTRQYNMYERYVNSPIAVAA